MAIAFAREGADILCSYLEEDEDAAETKRWVEQAGRRRRLYELTAQGASVLEQLRGEWRRFSTGVQAVVGGPA